MIEQHHSNFRFVPSAKLSQGFRKFTKIISARTVIWYIKIPNCILDTNVGFYFFRLFLSFPRGNKRTSNHSWKNSQNIPRLAQKFPHIISIKQISCIRLYRSHTQLIQKRLHSQGLGGSTARTGKNVVEKCWILECSNFHNKISEII